MRKKFTEWVLLIAISAGMFRTVAPRSLSSYELLRGTPVLLFAAIALIVPRKTIERFCYHFSYVLGPLFFVATSISLEFLGPDEVDDSYDSFFEVSALILPLFLLAILIDAKVLARSDMHPVWIYLNLTQIGAGLGAALAAIADERFASSDAFGISVGSLVGVFATIIASAIGRDYDLPHPGTECGTSAIRTEVVPMQGVSVGRETWSIPRIGRKAISFSLR
jgi:hypothetical protein